MARMKRLFRQYFIVVLLSGALVVFVLLKSTGNRDDNNSNRITGPQAEPPPPPKVSDSAGASGFLEKPPDLTPNQKISSQLSELEQEIQSQKEFSSILLNKVKAKYNVNVKNNVPISGETETIQHEHDLGSQAITVNSDKLLAVQKELHQTEVEHVGEVKSLEEQGGHTPPREKHGHEGNNNNDDTGAHEVVDDGDGNKDSAIAVLVFVCDRPTIKRCLDSLIRYRPSEEKFPIIVSQDCGHQSATTTVIESYGNKVIHIFQPDLRDISLTPREAKMKGYYKIARHYGWALNQSFHVLNYSNVIVVEDDLEVSPDFFEYFSGTLPLLREDPSLFCVSAWNDNGKTKRINESATDLLYRTDFFPGLGWMLTKELWNELGPKWPKSYWDDWLREPGQRKDRACIRPEISRTKTFGRIGVSMGTYYSNHLQFIKLNDKFVPFSTKDLSYLKKEKYDSTFQKRVYSSQPVPSIFELDKAIEEAPDPLAEFRLTYRTKRDFAHYAKNLELMDDLRAGVPRTAYRGIVSFMYKKHQVYLAPGANWSGYVPTSFSLVDKSLGAHLPFFKSLPDRLESIKAD